MLYIILSIFFVYFLFRKPSRPKSNTKFIKEPPKTVSFDLLFEPSIETKGKYLVIDIETTDLDINRALVVQLAWVLLDKNLKCVETYCEIIRQEKEIPIGAVKIHGIDLNKSLEEGIEKSIVCSKLLEVFNNCSFIVAHNVDYDIPILYNNFKDLPVKKTICTMKRSTSYCAIPKYYGRGSKYPKLSELVGVLFYGTSNVQIPEVHDADVDSKLTAKCFIELKNIGIIKA